LDRIQACIEDALGNAQCEPHEIDFVVLAGDGFEMPFIQDKVFSLLDEAKWVRGIKSSEIVAKGAAIVGAADAGIK
jgi:molecular chaperone DnaK (HSP70)